MAKKKQKAPKDINLRERLMLTQREFANFFGISASAVNMSEKKARLFPSGASADYDILLEKCSHMFSAAENFSFDEKEKSQAMPKLKKMIQEKTRLLEEKKEKYQNLSTQYQQKLRARKCLSEIETSQFKKLRKEKELVISIRLRTFSKELESIGFLQQKILLAEMGGLEEEIRLLRETLETS